MSGGAHAAAREQVGRGVGGWRRRDWFVPAAAVVLGVAAGLVWQAVTPRPDFLITVVGPFPATEAAARSVIDLDGWYAVPAAACGLVLGVLVFALARRLAAWAVLMLVGVAAMAEFVEFVVGQLVANQRIWWSWMPTAGDNHRVTGPLVLHAWGATVVGPLVGLLALLLLVTFAPDRTHGPRSNGETAPDQPADDA